MADDLPSREKLEIEILPRYLPGCRWFGGKARTIQNVSIREDISMTKSAAGAHILLLEVGYTDGATELYLLPLSFACGEKAKQIAEECSHAVIGRLRVGSEAGVLYESVYDEEFRNDLLNMIARSETVNGKVGGLVGYPGQIFSRRLTDAGLSLPSRVLEAEQSNSSILYQDTFFLKLYRRLENGVNPDLEMARFLTEKTSFPYVPPFAGALEWRRPGAEPISVGLLQGFVPNVGDAWTFTLDAMSRYFDRVLSRRGELTEAPALPASLLDIEVQTIPALLQDLIGGVYLEMAGLLGRRTGELHLALASANEDPNLAPEPFSTLDQQSVYQAMQDLARRVLQSLENRLNKLPEHIRAEAAALLASQPDILNRWQRIMQSEISAMKIRIHGDYHLGQVLYTGTDFVIIDFEGEPARALSERRLKRSPLQDVAGMIRSFHYAGYGALFLHTSIRPEDIPALEPWADLWSSYVSGVFLQSYLRTVGDAAFVPSNREEFDMLLQAFLLEKAVYELGYELNNRPDWVIIPVRGIMRMLRQAA